MKYKTLYVIIVLINHQVFSQNITSKAILESAFSTAAVQQQKQLADWSRQLDFRVPLLKEVQVRLGINGSALGDTLFGYLRNEDVYGLQLSTNSLRERAAQRAVGLAQSDVYAATTRALLRDALTERYQALAEATLIGAMLTASRQLDSLLAIRQSILLKNLQTGVTVRPKDIIDLENDRQNAARLRSNWEGRWHNCAEVLRQFIGHNLTVLPVANWRWPHPDQWAVRITAAHQTTYELPDIAYRTAKTKLAMAELDYAQAQNRQVFNLLRVGYDYPLYVETPKRLNPFNNFSVRLGLTVPLPGNNRFKAAKAMLEVRENQWAADNNIQEHATLCAVQYAKWESALRAWQLHTEQATASLLPTMLKNPTLSAQLSPEEVADIQISLHKRQIQAIEIQYELIKTGLQYLSLCGALQAAPLRNYLSDGFEVLEGAGF